MARAAVLREPSRCLAVEVQGGADGGSEKCRPSAHVQNITPRASLGGKRAVLSQMNVTLFATTLSALVSSQVAQLQQRR